MPLSPGSAVRRALCLLGALSLAAVPPSAARAQNDPATPRFNAGETVSVDVRIVPFYAVDAQGKPVYDLRPDEVELRVGGVVVPIDSFDPYAIAFGRSAAPASPLAPALARTVYFLFDTTFSSPTGFKTDQRLAARMIEGWPAGDRLFLVTHGSRAGLERRLGPVPPDAEGKKELLKAVAALSPEVRRVELQDDPTIDFSPPAETASRKSPAPGSQMAHVYNNIQGTMRGEYHGVASDLARSLGDLAGVLRQTPGPKLLVLFSQGLDDNLYFQGDSGFKVGSDESVRVDTRRAPPLVDRFRGPLRALAEAGAMAVFVNTDRDPGIDGDAVLRDMAKTTGGLYVEGRDPRDLESRIAGSTTAYYEAGFRPSGTLLAASRADVAVTVKRPGVRAWAPAAVQTREAYRTLSAFEKRRMVIDIVAGGPAAQRAHGTAQLALQELGGRLLARKEPAPRLGFEAAWPAELAARRLDLYNVVLAPPAGDRKGKVLRFDGEEGTAAADRARLETTLDGEGEQLWGIVAVDPETDRAWVHRLRLKAGSPP
jgi:hypothetical protein